MATPGDILRIKQLLPTALGSEELRSTVARDILRRSVFSARMESVRHLATIRDVCAAIVDGEINQATARERLLASLAQMGHSPQDGDGLTNPASERRLNLIIDTQRQMAASAANISAETPESLDDWPAVELTRFVGRRAERQDWPQRWAAAGFAVGWQGALKGDHMVALKASPIWQALGNGEGGFRDALGNPYPPFAFNSGLAWADVSREEAESLGLLAEGEAAPAPQRPSLSPGDAEMAEAASRLGFDNLFNDLLG